MTAKEKANAGLWLLKQAVLDIIGNGGMQPSQVRDALGWPTIEAAPAGVAYAVMLLMEMNGELTKDAGSHPAYRKAS